MDCLHKVVREVPGLFGGVGSENEKKMIDSKNRNLKGV